MSLSLSQTANAYLLKKQKFYASQKRKARIILVARTCHGAEFRLIFEVPQSDDVLLTSQGMEVYLSAELLEEYGGFSLDTDSFFFAPRLRVTPLQQSFKCDCPVKCNTDGAMA